MKTMPFLPMRLAVFAALVLFASNVRSQQPSALDEEPEEESPAGAVRVGHWLEVNGTLGKDGVFQGEEVELKEPESRQVLIGAVAWFDHSSKTFELLGRPVTMTANTELEGVNLDALRGVRVKVEGVYYGPQEFRAVEISKRGGGRDRIGGRVDEVIRTGGKVIVRIMNFRVALPGEIEHREPIEKIRTAPAGLLFGGGPDEDDLFGEGIPLGERVRLAGQVELGSTAEENFDLDREDREDRRDDQAAARLRLQWQASPKVFAVAEGRGSQRHRTDEDSGSSTIDNVRLGETFLYFRSPFNDTLDFQLGRQDFDDRREWLYDENLDGLRVIQRYRPVRIELSVSTQLSDGSPRDEESTNWIGYLAHERRGDRHFAWWGMHRRVNGVPGDRPTHVGFRFLSKRSWFDVAYLTGQLASRDVSGWGLDLGRTFEPKSFGPLSFTLAYAYGSGDNGHGDSDHTFRQTGYQDNSAKFAGVTSFLYYGELVDPELANLHIATAGVGARLARRTSLDLVAHSYRQDHPRTRLFDSALDGRPDGVHDDLGWEFDLVFGERRWKGWDLEAVAAYFVPGDAFVDEDEALLGRVQLRFRF